MCALENIKFGVDNLRKIASAALEHGDPFLKAVDWIKDRFTLAKQCVVNMLPSYASYAAFCAKFTSSSPIIPALSKYQQELQQQVSELLSVTKLLHAAKPNPRDAAHGHDKVLLQCTNLDTLAAIC